MSISYAVTTHNEGECIDRLLSFITNILRDEDELIILDDFSNDKNTISILKKYKNVFYRKFKNNYCDHKNYLNSLCTRDFIFQIDADEIPTLNLIKFIQRMLEIKSDVDLYWIPRENRLSNIDIKYIENINWKIDKLGRINYPDYQGRVYKRSNSIHWTRPVHEIITGHKSQMILPKNSGIDILHHRDMTHQLRSNLFYEKTFK